MPTDKIKVLIVEDNQTLADIYTIKFQQIGYDYKWVGDGEAGLEEAKSFLPDIILLDIIMPKMDGFAVLKGLKENKKTEKIPVILLTNLGQSEDVRKGLELGATTYLVKADCTPSQLVKEIENTLKKSKDKK